MYRVSIETHFDSAHQLNGYPGACGRLHGHRWRIQVEVETGQLDPVGISVDFKALSAWTDSILERFDHQYLNEVPPFNKINPTAENLGKHVFDELASMLPAGVRMSRVTVWESDKYAVSYAPEPVSGA
jgi:6-pyruvoyltetrahydropterin/6-carboxytetrahydropterin synthase